MSITLAVTWHELISNTYEQVAITIFAILLVQLILHASIERIVGRIVHGHHRYESELEEKKRKDTLTHFLHATSGVALWAVGIIIILFELNVNIAALLTGAGVVSVVFGLGAQSMIKDLLAGMFVILENQYGVGDIVEFVNGTSIVNGLVEEVNIRTTTIRDLSGNLHVVPNGFPNYVTNMTHKYANVNIDIDVDYESDVDKVEKVINETGEKLAADPKLKELFVQPIRFVRIDNFKDSSITIKALGRVQPGQQWDTAGQFRREIKKAFDKAGIDMPYQQIVVRQAKKK